VHRGPLQFPPAITDAFKVEAQGCIAPPFPTTLIQLQPFLAYTSFHENDKLHKQFNHNGLNFASHLAHQNLLTALFPMISDAHLNARVWV